MNFLKDGLSLNEFKFSSLVFVFLIVAGVAIYSYLTSGDITGNWLDLAKTLIYVIGGVNAINGISSVMNKVESAKKTTKKEEASEQYPLG